MPGKFGTGAELNKLLHDLGMDDAQALAAIEPTILTSRVFWISAIRSNWMNYRMGLSNPVPPMVLDPLRALAES